MHTILASFPFKHFLIHTCVSIIHIVTQFRQSSDARLPRSSRAYYPIHFRVVYYSDMCPSRDQKPQPLDPEPKSDSAPAVSNMFQPIYNFNRLVILPQLPVNYSFVFFSSCSAVRDEAIPNQFHAFQGCKHYAISFLCAIFMGLKVICSWLIALF